MNRIQIDAQPPLRLLPIPNSHDYWSNPAMVFKWLDTKEVDEFANLIVAEIIRRLPPTAQTTEKKLIDKLAKTHNALVVQTVDFARSRKLNVYQKARLGNRFKWGLKEAGYPDNLIDAWTYELVTFVAVNSKDRGSTPASTKSTPP